MLHVFICEDNEMHRTHIEGIVNRQIFTGTEDMALTLSVAKPEELLAYIEEHTDQTGIYFLDIELESDINGIELAAKIKKLDASATIVFITTHSEMVHYVFKLKIEAMEYILKDSPAAEIRQRVISCIQAAYQRFLDGKHAKSKYFTIKVGVQKVNTLCDDIMYFESSTDRRNKILLHKINGELEFYGTVADVSNLGPPFFKCHQSYVVNKNHVRYINIIERKAELTDGTIIPVARQKMTEFLKVMK